jgi:hypothetical protein
MLSVVAAALRGGYFTNKFKLKVESGIRLNETWW